MAGRFSIKTLDEMPAKPGHPKAHDDDTHAELLRRLHRARDYRWAYEINWTLNILFYYGHHWAHWSNYHKSLRTPKAPAYRVRHRNNQFKKLLHERMGRFIRQRTKWSALPASEDTDDEARAINDERWLQYAWRAIRMPGKVATLSEWVAMTGNGGLEISWDKTGGQLQPRDVLDENGVLQIASECPACMGSGLDAEIQQQNIQNQLDITRQLTGLCPECDGFGGTPQVELKAIGEVTARVLNPYNVFFEPGALNADDSEYVIIRRVSSLQDARRTMPEAAKYISIATAKPSISHIDAIHHFGMASHPGTATNHGNADRVEIYDYYGKPTDEHPNGRVYRFTRTHILEEFDNPFPQNGHHPIAWFTDFPIPGSVYGQSIGDDLRPMQKEYNRLHSMLLEHGNLAANPVLLRSADSIVSEVKGYPMPGQVLEYVPGAVEPRYLQIPPMTADIAGQIAVLKNDMREIALVVDKEATPGKLTGRLIALQKEGEEESNAHQRTQQKEAFELAGQMSLNIVKRMTDEDRSFSIIGKSNKPEFGELEPGEDSRIPSDVYISEGDVLPDSKIARIEVVSELAPFFIDPETGMPDNERILAMMDLGSEEIDRSKQERDNAERENRQIIKQPNPQEPAPISMMDDHKAHFETHLKKLRTFTVNHPTRVALEAHAMQHQQMLQQAQQAVLAASQQQIAGGSEPMPGAGTPPGQQNTIDPTQSAAQRISGADAAGEALAAQQVRGAARR